MNNDLINSIIDLYKEKKFSIESISKKFNVGSWKISKILRENNVVIRDRFAFSRKYPLDESFFEKIDNEQKAYWLGFLYADGAVYKKEDYYFHLTLQDGDVDRVELLRQHLQTTIPLRKDAKKKQMALMIHSKKMVLDLIRCGCSPKKSFTIRFPDKNILPIELIRHFVRGYFDGDGTVSFREQNSRVEARIISNVNFCNDLKDILFKMVGIDVFYQGRIYKTKDGQNAYTTIGFGRTDHIINFYNFLYKDSLFFLKRKKDIFDKYIKYKTDKNHLTRHKKYKSVILHDEKNNQDLIIENFQQNCQKYSLLVESIYHLISKRINKYKGLTLKKIIYT